MAQRPAKDGRPAWAGAADALYGAALRLYPRAFRERWGEPMRQAFRDRCREVARGERSGVALLHESLADIAAAAGREHANAAGAVAPQRFWLALACLLLLAGTLAAREQLAYMVQLAGEAASVRWSQLQAALEDRALRHYWDDVADGLDGDVAPGAPTTRAFALLGGGSAERARGLLRDAMAAGDPRAFWLVATACQHDKACGIDVDAALARWQRVEPDNAAPALFALERAAATGDAAGVESALSLAARATTYRAHDIELLKSLFKPAEAVRVPTRLRAAFGLDDPSLAADALAIDAWSKFALPRFDALHDRCRPATVARSVAECVAVGKLLADSNVLLGRLIGERLLCRYQCAGPDRASVAARIAERQWVFDNMQFKQYNTRAWRPSWIHAWHADDVRGEFDVDRHMLRDRGIDTRPPPGYRVPARSLDPNR
ncbi:MAG TPA: hypothetical protein VL118_11705 [Luteimonas sp.]|nr:hypothetical protein [Luteimonas sp.]